MSRPSCPRCRLPCATCLCARAVAIDNEVDVLVLQHPQEAHSAKGSVRLLALSLARCRVAVGARFDPAVLGDAAARAVLLYPGPPEAGAAPVARPGLCVLLDGTWRQSRRLLADNPWLAALPRCGLPAGEPGRYGPLRRAHRPGQLSTLEATCRALAAFEGEAGRYRPLLEAFEGFVAEAAARRGAR